MDELELGVCPHCRTQLNTTRGDHVYSRAQGVEIRGAYDGVLFFQCPTCHGAWHRFTDDRAALRRRAQPYIDQINRNRVAGK